MLKAERSKLNAQRRRAVKIRRVEEQKIRS
jgi:hypothetical protein